MSKNIERFREFVKPYPKFSESVKNNETTWQKLFEEWYVMGDGEHFDKYKGELLPSKRKEAASKETNTETLNTIVNLAKNVNVDSIKKGLDSATKILNLVNGIKGNNTTSNTQPNPTDSIFDKKYNDWY